MDADDLDELIGATGPGAKDCAVGWWLANGTHDDVTNGRLALAVDGNGGHAATAAAFDRRGMAVGADAVGRHRRGLCRCPR